MSRHSNRTLIKTETGKKSLMPLKQEEEAQETEAGHQGRSGTCEAESSCGTLHPSPAAAGRMKHLHGPCLVSPWNFIFRVNKSTCLPVEALVHLQSIGPLRWLGKRESPPRQDSSGQQIPPRCNLDQSCSTEWIFPGPQDRSTTLLGTTVSNPPQPRV